MNLKEYYKSKHWVQFSKSLLDNTDCECALCHRKRWHWQVRKKVWKRELRFAVHHINYLYINEEQNHPECYLILCSHCHNICHDISRSKNISPFYNQLFEIITKYGFIYEKEVTS